MKDYFVFVIYYMINSKPLIINVFNSEDECLTHFAILVQVSKVHVDWRAVNLTAELEQII